MCRTPADASSASSLLLTDRNFADFQAYKAFVPINTPMCVLIAERNGQIKSSKNPRMKVISKICALQVNSCQFSYKCNRSRESWIRLCILGELVTRDLHSKSLLARSGKMTPCHSVPFLPKPPALIGILISADRICSLPSYLKFTLLLTHLLYILIVR